VAPPAALYRFLVRGRLTPPAGPPEFCLTAKGRLLTLKMGKNKMKIRYFFFPFTVLQRLPGT
jgi:hypothetical protein